MYHLDNHQRFPSMIIGCMNWILKSLEAAKIPNQPKPKTQLSITVRPVCGQESTKEIEKGTEFDHNTPSQEKHDEVTDSTSTVRPVGGSKSIQSCVLTPTKVEEDQTRTVRPVLVEKHDIDLRVPGLCHMQL